MNALESLACLRTPAEDGLLLRLKTRTPLYTGGIGQLGDQIHPSNLLGGIRHMSCLVARTLGDDRFEATVWGNPGLRDAKARAKQIALHWDTRKLEPKVLPPEIRIPRDSGKNSRWWFNTAFEGDVALQVSRRGISDAHWKLLTLALAIQLRHGSFGSKDQFGLGVMAPLEDAPFCDSLDTSAEWAKQVPAEPGKLNLLRYAFGRLHFRVPPGQRPRLDRQTALTLALATRATMRNALRARPDAPEADAKRLTDLRHRMLGQLNQAGSAVNVSAAYGAEECPELRVLVALRSENKDERQEIMKLFNSILSSQLDGAIDNTGYRMNGLSWEFGGAHTKDRAAWLNKLAGVQA